MVILILRKFLRSNRNARKIFGKKEIEIILKQLDGISLSQSEKNRLSRDIRPKLEFIEGINEFKDEFKLKKNQDNKKIIGKAVDLILKDKLNDRIKAILLFGSMVKGVVTTRSDIDICVVFDDIERDEADRLRIRILGNFSTRVDIQVFNILPQKIKRSIASSHRILHKRENFDNTLFSIKYLKDEDFFIRKNRIFGEVA